MDKDEQLRLTALDLAIKSGAATSYNDMTLPEVSDDKLIEAAKKFEKFIKGE